MSVIVLERKKKTPEEVKAAIKTIIEWIGDDINRPSLKDTPERVLKSYNEIFSGYKSDPRAVLQKTFINDYKYSDFILLKDIEFSSTCEHHMLPIAGVVHIAYIPDKKIVGISKLVRVVEILSKRLQIQENLTVDIATVIYSELDAKGVAICIEAEHFCMSIRGVNKQRSKMKTFHYLGNFIDDKNIKKSFLESI